jgi:hypothetical protein
LLRSVLLLLANLSGFSASRADESTAALQAARMEWMRARCMHRIGAKGDWWGRTFRVTASSEPGGPRRRWFMRDRFLSADLQCPPDNETPVGTAKRFLLCLATQDTADLARLLTPDYRLTSDSAAFGARAPLRMDRAAQIGLVARLAETRVRGPWEERYFWVLAEFPDTLSAMSSPPGPGACHEVALRSVRMGFGNHPKRLELLNGPPCFFVMVRGDSLPLGTTAETQRWYVARWHIGAGLDPDTDRNEHVDEAGHHADHRLGVRQVSALGEWPVVFEATLPRTEAARLELFDVAGRRRSFVSLPAAAPGAREFRLDSPDLAPGIYWLRLEQQGRNVTARLVVLR